MGFLKLFKRKASSPAESALADAKAQKIASAILRFQRKAAEGLNSRFLRLGEKRGKALLVVLGVAFGGYCFYVLFSAVLGSFI